MSFITPQDMFNTFLRRTAKKIIYRKICPRSHFWEVYGQSTNFPRVNAFDIPKLLKKFFKILFKVTGSANKVILLKLVITKDITVSVNKESMNKSSYKNVFLRFQLYLELTWATTIELFYKNY